MIRFPGAFVVARNHSENDLVFDPTYFSADALCWKLLLVVKLIGVTHLPFKSELLRAIDNVWKHFIEPATLPQESESAWQSEFPGL